MTNKEIIQDYSKRVWVDHDLTAVDDVFAKDVIIHSPLNRMKGNFTMKELIQKWLTAFPDLEINMEHFIAEDDLVVSRWSGVGTHMGSFFETNPTHRDVAYSGVTTYKLKDGKVVEYWALVDMHAILSQLEIFESVADAVE